ncbi:MAG: DUF2059 domain-containing protein [Chthoniobacterales bacterium]
MFLRVLLILTICSSLVRGAGSPSPSPSPSAPPSPTEASVKQLLEVAQAHKLVDSVMKQMDILMLQAIAQATKGQPVPEKVQNDIDQRRREMNSLMKELLDWKKLEPIYVRIYQKSFTQAEVDGMIAFYKTPAGQAMIGKMPAVMQNSIDEMQQLMGPVMEKIQRTQQDVAAGMKTEPKPKSGK